MNDKGVEYDSMLEVESHRWQDTASIDTLARKRNDMCRVYFATIFRALLPRGTQSCDEPPDDSLNEYEEDLVLPSNEDWRCKIYYRLVERQRESGVDVPNKRVDEVISDAEMDCSVERKSYDWEWEPKECGYGLKAKPKNHRNVESKEGSLTTVRGIGGSMTEACVQLGWRVNDIPLAAKVLRKEQPAPTYSDEAEMRRVYGLVYDVFRYKRIFIRALEDIGFWRRNEAIKDQQKVVWLLLYDMQGRKFIRPRARMTDIIEREKIFEAAGLKDVESALLEVKTHLAASISRQRIRGSALNLDELLPTRLRVIEGLPWGTMAAIASGWINTTKFGNKEEFLGEMSKLKLVCCENDETTELEETEYAFDSICPKVVDLHESARETLAVSSLVREHRFVFLERSLCLGAAVLARVIRNGRLCGPIILTHSLAPRHTGYLAGLLADIGHAGKLLAFGAGDRRYEYETYLKDLGVTLQQCRVFSEKYVSHPATSELERATIVLAVPSCSYTGVKDIVDLAVARGGDAALLESLTDTYPDDTDDIGDDYYNHEQWRTFLTDQMSTLKYALTRPNVQFLLYEVHTISPLESTEMVRAVVDYVNRLAMEKYIREHPRKASKEVVESTKLEGDCFSTVSANVTVPNSDLFEVASIEDIYGENAGRMLDPGCFLAIIRRKEMMQFDSLFMIKVAESKGLFGDSSSRQLNKSKLDSAPDRSPRRSSQASVRKRAKRANKIEIERIMAHTYSSLSRSTQENRICPRHERCASWGGATDIQAQPIENSDIHPKVSGPDVSPSKAWQRQKGSVNRLSATVGGKLSRKKELRAINSMFSPGIEYDSSILQAATKHEENSPLLTNLLTLATLPRDEHNYPSSTILRSPILARAVRRVPLENHDIDDREEEKIQPHLKMSPRCWTSRKTSRLFNPGGSPSNVLDSLLDVA